MTAVLRIRDWIENYETSETRKLKHLQWVRMPVKQDGDGYTDLVSDADPMAGPLRLAAWVAMLQLAGRCDPRGTLWRTTGAGRVPHDVASIARITRLPPGIIDRAIPKLIEIGWLESVTEVESRDLPESQGNPPELRENPPARGEERRGEEKREEEREGEAAGVPALSPSEDSPPPSSKPNKRERLLAILEKYGCTLVFNKERIFPEWCNVVGDYPIEFIDHLMRTISQRPHMPSGLRKILKQSDFDYAAWKIAAKKATNEA